MLGAGYLFQHVVQIARGDFRTGRQADLQRAEELAQIGQFFFRRRRMHPVHAGAVQALELLGGGHVGQHHELLDQLVAVQARARGN